MVAASVTRFGEIPPLWQIFKNLWQYILGLFGFGQCFQLTLAQFECFWANFHLCKWPNIENTIWSSGHTGGRPHLFMTSGPLYLLPLQPFLRKYISCLLRSLKMKNCFYYQVKLGINNRERENQQKDKR